MRYSLSFREGQYFELTSYLLQDRAIERAAYLLCSQSASAGEVRLLVREVILLGVHDVETATERDLVIRQHSYLAAIKKAASESACFVLVHSHPAGEPEHSRQDDREEARLFRTAYVRIHAPVVHASLVISDPSRPIGRVWLEDGTAQDISRIRVIGDRFVFYDRSGGDQTDFSAFDRQILAFGEDVQRLLGHLHVGVVGLGGTGSSVVEQLVRLGVGTLTICDPQEFEKSNVNRLYGSRVSDVGKAKVDMAHRNAQEIGLGTTVNAIQGSITEENVARTFRDCDVIFGCTDDEWGRSILNRVAMYYLIPVIDLGVMVDSHEGLIKSITGRVTTLLPGDACLICRQRINSEGVKGDVLKAMNPTEYEQLVEEGYVRGLRERDPAVVMFTTATAAFAVSELMHRITGFMGAERVATELLVRFDYSKVSMNSQLPRAGCWCANPAKWGLGDTDPLLELSWVS